MSNKFTLTTQLKAEISDFKKGLNNAQNYNKKFAKNLNKSFGGVSNNLTNIAGAIGLTFGARELFTYAKDAVELSNQMAGVEEAFNKLKGVSLQDLRKETKGTASDFQLMKAAVKAAEFGIDASKMPQLMQFAAVQANKMGESVDYMVESIVTGLARNSIPILDNLGLSSVMLKEKMKETGDISSAALAVINEKLKESGGLSDNAGVKASQLQADFNNLKAEIGKELTPAFNELFGALKDNLPTIMQQTKAVAGFIAQNFDLILKLSGAIGGFIIAMQAAKAAQAAFNVVANANPYVLLATALVGVAVALNQMKKGWQEARQAHYDYFKQLKKEAKGEGLDKLSDKELITKGKNIKSEIKKIKSSLNEGGQSVELEANLKTQLKYYEQIYQAIRNEAIARDEAKKEDNVVTTSKIENLDTLQNKLKELQDQQKTASLNEIGGINDQIKKLQEKIKKYQDATSEVKKYNDEVTKPSKGIGENLLGKQVKYKKKDNTVGLDQEVNPFALREMKSETLDQESVNEQLAEQVNWFDQLGEKLSSSQFMMEQFGTAIMGVSDAFIQMALDGEISFKSMVTSMLEGIRSIINALLAEAIAGMIAKEASSKGIWGLATAGVGITALSALWQSQVPEFANGGLVYGDTLARVGEYSGAKSNPEVIAPLNKLKSFIQPTSNSIGGDVRFKIQGTELVGVLNNYDRKLSKR